MKIEPNDDTMIGARLMKDYWSQCYFDVEDVGHRFIMGKIVDPQIGKTVAQLTAYPLSDDDWLYWYDRYDALNVIENLPVTGEK